MFTVMIDKIFVLYLLSALGVVLISWAVFKITEMRSRYKPKSEKLFRCPICLYMHVDSGEKGLVKCPRCGSYNESSRSET